MKYRTPKIEEFHQGFKYQIAHDQQMIIWDAKSGVTEEFEKQRLWFDREVYWMGKPKKKYTECGEYGCITVDGPTYDFFYRTEPFVLKDMLEQDLIRVEDDNH